MVQLAAAATLAAVCLLLAAERTRARRGVWLWKPLASLGFLAVAVLGPSAPTPFGHALLAGLVLCAAGDVLLIPEGQGAPFLAGIGCFALGHLAYALGFAAQGVALGAGALGLCAMALVLGLTLHWLAPHLPRALGIPVRVYMLVIAAMVASAVSCSAATGDLRIAVGAVAFAISDLSVARERFVRPSFGNLSWGLPLYYAAQMLIAWSSAGV
jgi:uncharacterized membrane protein YhhN